VQYLGELGAEIEVFRNDRISLQELESCHPEAIVISPGPGDPSDAGISQDVIRTLGKSIPTLGVCLGHQCIGQVFGGRVVRAPRLMHGKTSLIHHNDTGIFAGIPNPFEATRYHSLIVSQDEFPADLEITALTKEGEIMALRHAQYPIFGVQFHPESILTDFGKQILNNFLTTEIPVFSEQLSVIS
jgi:anthranilate synthase/aminodeoxychorismate synthase-like glutamine amidotransferase